MVTTGAASRPRMIFNAFTQITPSHHYEGLWRTPWGQASPIDSMQTWLDVAKTIEAAKFDGLFIADGLGLMAPFGGSHRAHAEGANNFPNGDALIVAAALAGVTEHISLGFTSSLIQAHPFELARLASTLDQLTGGRVAWNIVPSGLENSFRNMNFDQMPTYEERYARADEYLKVVFSLWEGSWEMDAVVRDAARGIYADASKIYRINHRGPLYSVQGPHLSAPSPQRVPFLYTAGMSPRSLRLAAQHAEALLIMTRTPEDAAQLVAQLDALLPEYGRRPGDVKVIQLLRFVVGSTEAEAKRRHEEILEYVNPRGHVVESGGILGMDLGYYDLDEEIDISHAPGAKGIFGAASGAEGRTTATPRQIAAATDIPPTVGTPEQIADVIERWQDAGVSGINVADAMFHRYFTDFAEQVMPELRRRGMAQREYAPGTFRDKVFGEGPHLPDRHPAAAYRGAFTDSIG
ncbi:LLM class flavin-dependent oxidoreductase [Microbacterium paludicola]|uniref:LLM class flavin-dependent oxidoreductase n=1 Tax=Microbacterium paludicola TaxID=300019 RepID=A0A4Y9FV51_9MICO|nr:NtaA/DmoA family FMN-dependent monooxygenase [Microbacterium paludicola]MBF0817173.1 NtaA/DmoA family FMN-dependent monooxygenase [Microbacterium paludicola]TFU32101.1 LLM class flavin-dependent oxidoreductase [Microbacterium paludicola]